MGNNISTLSLIISVVAIFLIFIILGATLFTSMGQSESRNLVNWLIFENLETDTSNTFIPQNNFIFRNISRSTTGLNLTIQIPSGISSRGNMFKIFNASTNVITLVEGTNIILPLVGKTIPAGKTYTYLWISNTAFDYISP